MTNLRYWPFEFGRKTKANAELQKRLIAKGFDVGPDGADGIFGEDTRKALMQFQSAHKLDASGTVDRATEDALFPGNYDRRTPSMSEVTKPTWLSNLTGNTIVNYLITFIGGVIAAKFGLDPDLFRDNLPNLIDAIIGVVAAIGAVIAAFRGIKSAATPKVNIGGETVKLADMPPSAQAKVVAAVETTTGKPVASS